MRIETKWMIDRDDRQIMLKQNIELLVDVHSTDGIAQREWKAKVERVLAGKDEDERRRVSMNAMSGSEDVSGGDERGAAVGHRLSVNVINEEKNLPGPGMRACSVTVDDPRRCRGAVVVEHWLDRRTAAGTRVRIEGRGDVFRVRRLRVGGSTPILQVKSECQQDADAEDDAESQSADEQFDHGELLFRCRRWSVTGRISQTGQLFRTRDEKRRAVCHADCHSMKLKRILGAFDWQGRGETREANQCRANT